MEATGQWKIWSAVGGEDWYVARSRNEAIAALFELQGCKTEADAIENGYLDGPDDMVEVDDLELDQLMFVDQDENERTFREELALQLASGLAKPEHFASTNF